MTILATEHIVKLCISVPRGSLYKNMVAVIRCHGWMKTRGRGGTVPQSHYGRGTVKQWGRWHGGTMWQETKVRWLLGGTVGWCCRRQGDMVAMWHGLMVTWPHGSTERTWNDGTMKWWPTNDWSHWIANTL